MKKSNMLKAIGFGVAVVALAAPGLASHAWSNYHWAKGSGELTVATGDNVDSRWDSYLVTAVNDWNKSTVIQSSLVAGMTNPKNCKAVAGRIEVCNSAYGQTGWLGIAQIWLSNGHISQGITKLNDTYFETAKYNTPSWRALVTCQEIGHDYGLGHQDEDFNTDATNSCMDYTNLPAGNEHPDAHDYDQLLAIYNHAESSATVTASRTAPSAGDGGNSPAQWGRAVSYTRDGKPNVFVQDVGNGLKKVTHVTWAPDAGPRHERTH